MNYRIDFREQYDNYNPEYRPIILNVQNMAGREIEVVTHEGDTIEDLKMFILDNFAVFFGEEEVVPELEQLNLINDETKENVEDYYIIDGTDNNEIHDGLTLHVFITPLPYSLLHTIPLYERLGDNESYSNIRITNNQIFAAKYREASVDVFSIDGVFQRTHDIGIIPCDMCVSPDGNILYLVNPFTTNYPIGIYMYDMTTSVLRSIDNDFRGYNRGDNLSHINICLSDDGSMLFVSIFQSFWSVRPVVIVNEVRIYRDLTLVKRIALDANPLEYDFSSVCAYKDGKLFKADGDYISIIDEDGDVGNIINVGGGYITTITASEECVFANIHNTNDGESHIIVISQNDFRYYTIPNLGTIIGYTNGMLYVYDENSVKAYRVDPPE